jgi:hypothetical protein
MATEEKREQRLQLLEDHIGRALRDSEASGELRSAKTWGQPLDLGDGYDETPSELRMGFKILKDAGVVPHEVTLMRELAHLRQALQQATQQALHASQDPNCSEAVRTGYEAQAATLRARLVDKQQQLDLRLERLRTTGSL